MPYALLSEPAGTMMLVRSKYTQVEQVLLHVCSLRECFQAQQMLSYRLNLLALASSVSPSAFIGSSCLSLLPVFAAAASDVKLVKSIYDCVYTV